MKILLAVASYYEMTGAEIYCYELAKELLRLGHEITVVSPRVGGTIKIKSDEAGIPSFPLYEIPRSLKFDVLHLQEPLPTHLLLQKYPHAPAVMTIHSQWENEKPVLSDRIRRYIAIRPDIAEKLMRVDRIRAEKIAIIPNGIDFARFNRDYMTEIHNRKIVLFVGTLDRLRKRTILDLSRRADEEDFDFWIVGKNHHFVLSEIPENAKYFPAVWEIERFVKACDETAGIMLGRTTIEGWACGKSGWIYDIETSNPDGIILSRSLARPPKDMSPFDIRNVTKRILALYEANS